MANEFGDSPVESTPSVNSFGDSPVSTPQFQVNWAPSAVPARKESDLDFIKRTTPELIESESDALVRAQQALNTPINIRVSESETQVPQSFLQAPIGQVFNDERHGLIRKVSDTNYEPVRTPFLQDVSEIIQRGPTALMAGTLSPIEGNLQSIAGNPDVRATGASVGGSVLGAMRGAPAGPAGMILGGMTGAALAEPYVRSQIPSTETEAAIRVLSGGLNTPITLFDRLALTTGPRVATAIEQGLLGSGIAGTQAVGTSLEQGRGLPDIKELANAMGAGGLTGAAMGGALGGQRQAPLLEPKQQNMANKAAQTASTAEKGNNVTLQASLNDMTATPAAPVPPQPISRAQRQAELEEAFGFARGEMVNPKTAEGSAAVFNAEQQRLSNIESRIQGLVDEISGGSDMLRTAILARRQNLDDESFLKALESQADYMRNPARQPDVVAREVNEEAGKARMAAIKTTEAPSELGAPNAFGDYAAAPDEAIGISMAGGTPEEVAQLRRGLAPLGIEGTPATRATEALPDLDYRPKAVQETEFYASIPESNGGLYISADVARPHLPGYDVMNPATTHGDAARIADASFREGLKRPDVDSVLFLAGGAGSGKSAGMQGVRPEGTLIYDTTFSSARSLERLDAAVKSGRPVKVVFTNRNLEDAYLAMLRRAASGEQSLVPDDVFLKGHFDSRKNVAKAIQKYNANENVSFDAIDNTVNGAAWSKVDNVADYVKRVGKNSPTYEQAQSTIKKLKSDFEAEQRLAADRQQLEQAGQVQAGQAQGLTETAPFLEFPEPNQAGTGELPNPQASRLTDQSGFVNPRLIAPLGGSAAGGITGFVGTERKEGESEQEFQARRLANAGLGAGAGLLGGSAVSAATRLRMNRLPPSANKELNKVRQILTPSTPVKKGMFEAGQDAAFDFLTRANTSWAPLEKLQRNVFKLVNKPFQAGAYYDLADRGESIAGAVVHAQREAGLIADVVNNLPKPLRSRLPEYLLLNRIKDRLEHMPLEAQQLQDAVGIAQAELDAAKNSFTGSKTLANAAAVNNRKAELTKAITALNEEADRLRVAGWDLNDPAKNNPVAGLAAMEQEIGTPAFQQLEAAGKDFQSIMLNNLRRQVDSGRMPQDVFNKIAGSSDFYAPFKVMKYYDEATAPAYAGGGRSVVNIQPITKKIVGIDDTDLKLANPLEPAFEQVYKGTLLAEKNRFLREVATLTSIDKNGEFIKMLGPEESARKGFKEVPFFRNGEVQRFEVADDVHEALTAPLSWAEKSIVLNSLKAGSTLFKMGATALQAPFQVKNFLVYDPARLAIMSKYGVKHPVDAFNFVFRDYPTALLSSVRTSLGSPDSLGEKWLSSGAANSTFARVYSPEAFAKTLPKEKSLAKVVWDNQFGLVPANNVAATVSSILEQTPKIAGLKRALRFEGLDKLSPVDRERKWREIVHELRNYAGSPDFNRMGTDMGIINVLMPFTNARWQGTVADAGRLASNSKEGTAAKARLAALVGIPAAGLMLWNLRPENKKDFNEIPERERMRGFFIPVYQTAEGTETVLASNPDGTANQPKYFDDRNGRKLRQYYVIPKREMPQLMGNATESAVRWLSDNDPKAFDQLGNTMLNIAAPVSLEGRNSTEQMQSMLSGVNPVIRTPMEVALNKDMFRQKPIIPEQRLGALATHPDLTYTPSTPEVYKKIAGMVPDEAPSLMRSPAVAQKVIEDFTGGLPRQFINPKDKPDQNALQRITRSFRRSENVDMTDTDNAIDVAKGESTAIKAEDRDVADAIVKFVTDVKDPARAQAVIQQGIQSGKISKAAYQEIVSQLKERSMGYTAEQSQIARLSKQERAFFFHERVKNMSPEERNQFIQDAVAKRLIDRDVAALMMQLK